MSTGSLLPIGPSSLVLSLSFIHQSTLKELSRSTPKSRDDVPVPKVNSSSSNSATVWHSVLLISGESLAPAE